MNGPSSTPNHRRAPLGALLLAVAVLLAACSSAANDADAAVPGGITNGFTHAFATFDGDETTIETLANGKPVVLNFFASTCAPCIAELPDFESVHQATTGEVTFVGLASDGDRPEDAAKLIEATGVTFDVGLDTSDSQFLRHYDGLGMPTTVFIRADGTVADSWTGALSTDSLNDKIDDLLR